MPSGGLNIIIFPLHDWKKCEKEGFRTRDAHLMLEFGKSSLVENILVIDRPISVSEMLLKRRWWRVRKGNIIYKKMNACLTQTSEKIHVLDCFSFGILKPLFLRRRWWDYIFRQRFILEEIKSALEYLQFHNFVLFLWNPLSGGVIGKLGEELLVFDAVDNWLEHPELSYARKEIEEGYDKIKKEADLIFTVSDSLKLFFKENRAYVYHIPNGVDIDFFQIDGKINIPSDIINISPPIVGYAGKIQERIDVSLMGFLAEKLPGINFVFIGQTINKRTVKSLLRYRNIHYLGDKHYSLLPYYLACFDICIIPHKMSRLTLSMDPIKLYEYLAAGKPVVTTDIAGVEAFKSCVVISKSKEEFLKGIKRYTDKSKREKELPDNSITNTLETSSWKSKAEEMISLMREGMERTGRL